MDARAMKIIEPSYEILQCPDGEQCLAFLERCARTCYKSEDKIDPGQVCDACEGKPAWKDEAGQWISCIACQGAGWLKEPSSHKLIRHVLERGHESVIEHMSITVKFIIDRGVSHELVRHRLCAFSQESTRYCNYGGDGKELTFIEPCFWPYNAPDNRLRLVWERAMAEAEGNYLELLRLGAKPEEARSVLPNSLKTEIVTTANLRQWRTMFRLRCSSRAHVQMRQVMQPLLRELRVRIPILFDDICLTDVPTNT